MSRNTTLAIVAIVSCGCSGSVVQSEIPNNKSRSGMLYSLPKGQIQVVASRKPVVDGKLTAAQKDAADALAASNAAAKVAADAKALSSTSTEYKTAQAAADKAKAKSDDAAQAVSVVTSNPAKFSETISIGALPPVPDSNRRFLANLNHGHTRDDTLKLTVSNGLLSTANATSTDQTPAIILNLVQGLVGLNGSLKFVEMGAFGPRATPDAPGAPKCSTYTYSAVFDPTNKKERDEAIAGLAATPAHFKLKIENTSGPAAADIGPVPDNTTKGLVYRAPRSVQVKVEVDQLKQVASRDGCTSDSIPDAASYVFTVPDSNAEMILAADVGPFTKSTYDFAFKDGTPTEYNLSQPSEIAAVATLPLDIAKGIVSIPAEIFKLRVDYDSQANALIKAKTDNSKALLDALNAQQALTDAKNKAATTAE